MPLLRTSKPRITYQNAHHTAKSSPRFIPIPVPQPADCTMPLAAVLTSDEIKTIQNSGQIVFHMVGDTGGYNGTDSEEAVAEAMEAQFQAAVPSFYYHLGDVIYYNGESTMYEAQFYEPYKFYPAVIFAIPGNHDGDTRVQQGDPPDNEKSLYGFFQNFCAPQSTQISTYRDTMTQPYVYWTLKAPFVTIIGLYGNVDGTLDGRGTMTQQQWLTTQLQNADPSTCIIVTVHQPPYSLDASHGGYPTISDAIDAAANQANVWPHAVFSGHVHDYQRFTRTVQVEGESKPRAIPYVIAGAGGYANTPRQMHKLQRDAAKNPFPCPSPTNISGVELRGYNERTPGFLRVTVTGSELTAEYFTVPFTGAAPTAPFDAVTLNYQTHTITNEMNPGTSGAA
jgi:Calcineurin-like phosphoesterase